ncbi:MAG: hypothetical protein ACRERD_22015 [Candidatus Binatia bacterium]
MVTEPRPLAPLPELTGRVAVLGGAASEKTALLLGLALRQIQQQGIVFCLDARRSQQTEIQVRLLLRDNATYVSLPPSGEVPTETAQTALKMLSDGLARAQQPPLLLLDSVHESSDWERTLSFLLKAGVVVIELLASPAALVFGRYDTVLLLRGEGEAADGISRAVGRKVSAENLMCLKAAEGILIHLARVQWVALPQ